MATAKKQFLIGSHEADWFIEKPVPADHPEEAVEEWEKSEGDGLSVGNQYLVYEVIGGPVNLTTVPKLVRA